MDTFKKKLSFSADINHSIIKLIGFIDSFKGRWILAEKSMKDNLKDLKMTAAIESTGSSTRIEGATLTNFEIESLIGQVKIKKLNTRDEQEVYGYYETLELIQENYKNIKLTENYIKQLHENLLKYSTKDERHRGNYKSLSNKLVATFPGGKQKVIFETTEPAFVELEMRNLIDWFNTEIKKNEKHILLLTGLFIYEFLSIHPFQDGNGRLSRLLTILLLLKNEYNFVNYASLENEIEKRKKDYYASLMSGQKNRGKPSENIEKWILFFLQSLKNIIEKLDSKYGNIKSKIVYLNERQEIILTFIENNQPVKIGDIAKDLTDISVNTIKKDLLFLKKNDLIISSGKQKGTIYFKFKNVK